MTVIQVVGNDSILELSLLRRLPFESPCDAVQAGGIGGAPRRSNKTSKRLERIRSTWKIDLAVNQRIDVHQTFSHVGQCQPVLFRRPVERLGFVAAVVIDGSRRVLRSNREQALEDVRLVVGRVTPEGMARNVGPAVDHDANQVLKVAVWQPLDVEVKLDVVARHGRRLVKVDLSGP